MRTLVRKADGTEEYFKVEKLRRSLRRAGASQEEISEITAEIATILYDGIKTQEIYRHAFELLRKSKPPAATRYSLRRALFGLGPTGFPFETFMARLFEKEGYTTDIGVTMAGHCAEHEIDVTAYKEGHSFVAEAKFHARPGIKSDLQVAMYSYARLLDLKDQKVCTADSCGVKEFWLITNTKFTSAAQNYALCVGLKILSWDFPKNDNLHDRVQRAGVYPITVLHSLSSKQIEALLARDIILCEDLLNKPHTLRHLHISPRKQEKVLSEAQGICHS